MANPTLNFTIKGRKFSLDISDVDGIEARDFRLAVGTPLLEATAAAMRGEIDTLELAAGAMWIIDRRENPAMTYEDALKAVHYATVKVDDEEENPSPPVEGGDSEVSSPPSLATTG